MMIEHLPAKALSVRQPWAWSIIHGGKDVENRVKRAITMGGMKPGCIAIHASKGMTQDEYDSAASFMASIGVNCPRPDMLVRGAVIGKATVTGIVQDSSSDWFFGPWALTLEQPIALEDPVPCNGQLGYFKWQTDKRLKCADPLPWMLSWPERPSRTRAPKKPTTGLLI